MSAKASVNVRVTRRFNAPAGQVFDAWLDPGMIGKWMFGPAVREEEVVRIALDARVGGSRSTGRGASCSPGEYAPRRTEAA